jgi:hemerythrin-like metal-binding protein
MNLFEWNDKLKTGIDGIDEQHKKLVDIINELHQAMRERRAKESISILLERLDDYTKYHFSYEEKELEKVKYQALDEQKVYHKVFIAKIAEMSEGQKKNEIGLSIDMLDFLGTWIKGHIMKEDMKYAPFLKP